MSPSHIALWAGLVAMSGLAYAHDVDLSRVISQTYRVHARTSVLAPALHRLQVERGLPALHRPGHIPDGSSGTAIHLADGSVISAQHVVVGATEVELEDASGQRTPAKVVRVEPDVDLALLQPAATLPGAGLLKTAPPAPGTSVYTVGHPMSGPPVVSRGVLSGTTTRGLLGRSRRTYLVTDAVVQPGHSGGPLVDEHGGLIGVLVGGFGPSSGAQGFGLVLPVQQLDTLTSTAPAEDGDLVFRSADDVIVVDQVSPNAHDMGLRAGMRLPRQPAPQDLVEALRDGHQIVRLVDGRRVVIPRTPSARWAR